MCFKLVSKEEINKNSKREHSPSLIDDLFIEGMAMVRLSDKLLEKIKQKQRVT